MSKNILSLVQLTLGQFWGFWDYDADAVAFNTGRNDAESWSSPEQQIPPDMVRGYDVAQGAMVGCPIAEAPAMFAEVIRFHEAIGEPIPQVWRELAKCKDAAAFAMEQREKRIMLWLNREGKVTYKVSARDANGKDTDAEIVLTYKDAANMLAAVRKVKITHFTFSGQRRTYAAPFTLALYANANKIPQAKALEYAFAFDVRSVKGKPFTALQALLLDENKQNAKAAYSVIGAYQNGYLLRKADPLLGETDLGRAIGLSDTPTQNKRGERQRISRWLRVDFAFPELEIHRRVALPETNDGAKQPKLVYKQGDYIPLRKLGKEDAACLLGEKPYANNTIVRRIYGKTNATVGDKEVQIATAEQVEEYFREVMEGTPAERITADNLKTYAQTKVLADVSVRLGDVLMAVVNNDKSWFAKLLHVANKEASNAKQTTKAKAKAKR